MSGLKGVKKRYTGTKEKQKGLGGFSPVKNVQLNDPRVQRNVSNVAPISPLLQKGASRAKCDERREFSFSRFVMRISAYPPLVADVLGPAEDVSFGCNLAE